MATPLRWGWYWWQPSLELTSRAPRSGPIDGEIKKKEKKEQDEKCDDNGMVPILQNFNAIQPILRIVWYIFKSAKLQWCGSN